MSLTRKHFEVIAKLIVFLETKEFATKQDIKAFLMGAGSWELGAGSWGQCPSSMIDYDWFGIKWEIVSDNLINPFSFFSLRAF